MRNYLDLLQDILNTGTRQANRTGTDAISLPGAMLKFDLTEGFPAMTTKKLAFKTMVGELIGFLQGKTSAADFRALGCNIWDQNANQNQAWLANPKRQGEDDLGRIYGAQWRDWRSVLELVDDNGLAVKSHYRAVDPATGEDAGGVYQGRIDQVLVALDTIRRDPTNRRILISAWRPDEFDQMALPPCHVLYQFLVNVEKRELNLCMYQRSCDMFLGVPFNIASAALLLSIFAKMTGLRPRHFTHFLADAHIYVNHVDQVKEQLSRTPYARPVLGQSFDILPDDNQTLAALRPHDFWLDDYNHHAAIAAPMAV